MLKIKYNGNATFALLNQVGRQTGFSITFLGDRIYLNERRGNIVGIQDFDNLHELAKRIEPFYPKSRSAFRKVNFLRAVAECLPIPYKANHISVGLYHIWTVKDNKRMDFIVGSFNDCLRFLEQEFSRLAASCICE